ncbi:cellulase family glycosylhydrolase [Paludibacter sp. 221]|uniref:cellulase family glycosylhydrolase n=1 Tax=Paludibacter sp. 221 TaxID=2302939 RepID=UPI0013D6D26E
MRKSFLIRLLFSILSLNILGIPAIFATQNAGTNQIILENRDNTPADYTSASAINQKLGRGINLGNMFDAPTLTAWQNPFKPEYIGMIANLGFDHVRMPIRWEQDFRSMQEYPYTINPLFLDSVKTVVDSALEHGMYIMINLHHHAQLMADPDGQKDRFVAHWEQIADFFKDYPDSLLFEILNEPRDTKDAESNDPQPLMTPEKWNEIYPLGLAAIRKTNPTRIVMIAPAKVGGVSGLQYLVLPQNDDNLIVTIHCYTPYSFTGQKPGAGVEWQGVEGERNELLTSFNTIKQFSQNNNNIPAHMGEFGANFNADMASRARWTTFVARTLEQENISWAYWEFCAERFGIYDVKTQQYHKPLVDALLYNSIPDAVDANNVISTVYKSNFQNGEDGWTQYASNNGLISITNENSYFKATISRVGETTGWYAQLLKKSFVIEKDKRYKVSFNAYSSAEFTLGANMGNSDTPWKVHGSANFPITTEEKNYSFIFQMKNDTDNTARIQFSIKELPLNENVFFKDIKIEEVSMLINEPEQHETVVVGNSITLSTIEYDNITYTWYYAENEQDEFELIQDAGNLSTYTFIPSTTNTGIYKVSYQTADGIYHQAIINLTVLPIQESSELQTGIESRSVTLSVPLLDKSVYTWEYRATETDTYSLLKSRIRANTHTLDPLSLSDKGFYRVSYLTDTEEQVVTFNLDVLPLSSSSQTVLKIQGDDITLTINNAPQEAEYTWEYSNDGGNSFVKIAEESTSSLSLTNLKVTDSGLYRVTYIHQGTAYSTTFELTVLPLIETEEEVKAPIGKPLTLSVDEHEGISYKWEYIAPDEPALTLSETSNSYTINEPAAENAGIYKVSFRTGTTAYVVRIRLTPLPLQEPEIQNITGIENSSIVLSVTPSTGATYLWEYAETAEGTFEEIKNELDAYSHQINTLAAGNAGVYRVSYATGTDFYIVTINLGITPSTVSTKSITEIQKESVTLVASDNTTLTYKWEYAATPDGVYTAVSNTQNEYSISALLPSDSGIYRVTYEYEDEAFVVMISLYVLPLNESETTVQGAFGQPITLSVEHHDGITYQWEHAKTASDEFEPIPNAGSSSFTIDNLTESLVGIYKVSYRTSTDTYIVKINLEAYTLEESSQDISKAVGDDITLSVPLYAGVSYKWEYAATAGNFTELKEGLEANTHTINNATVSNSGTYRVSYAYGNKYHIENINLKVFETTTSSQEVVGPMNGSITLSVTAYENITYKWEYSKTEDGTYAPLENTVNTYTLNSLNSSTHDGYYRVSYQTETAAFVTTIHLRVGEVYNKTTPGVEKSSVTLFVKSYNDTFYTWEYAETMEDEFSPIPDAGNTSRYTIESLTTEYAGIYKVSYYNTSSAYITYITLNVSPLSYQSIIKAEKESVTMSVELLSGTKYRWEFSETEDGDYTQLEYTRDANTYTIESLDFSNQGFYKVSYQTATNAYATIFKLTVLPLTESSQVVPGYEGESVTLSVEYHAEALYKWEFRKEGTVQGIAKQRALTADDGFKEIEGVTGNTYTINPYIPANNAGEYRVSFSTNDKYHIETITLSNVKNMVWKGTVDNDWNKPENWSPNSTPDGATDVYIPGNMESTPKYPILSGNKADNVCHAIYFMQGAEVARPDLLTYEKAYVVLNVGTGGQESMSETDFLSDVTAENRRKFAAANSGLLARQQWHMLSAPLKQMTSGGFAFGGYPLTFMRKWDIQSPEAGTLMTGRWTGYYRGFNENLTAGEGFILWINKAEDKDMYREAGNGTDNHFTANRNYGIKETNGILEFPYYEDDDMIRARRTQASEGSNLRYYYIYDSPENTDTYMQVTDKSDVYAFDQSAYRFVVEDNNRNFPATTTVAYNNENESRSLLIGNPYMSSVDFQEFYNQNSDKIYSYYKVWDEDEDEDEENSGFITYSFGTDNQSEIPTGDVTRYIPPMQSFVVTTKAATGEQSLTFNVATMTAVADGSNKLRIAGSNNSNDNNTNLLRVKISNGKASSQAVIAHQRPDATDAYNPEEDIYKLFSPSAGVPEVYTSVDNWAVEINHLSSTDITVPVCIKGGGEENMEFSITGMNRYDGDKAIYFIDSEQGNTINISGQEHFTYSFSNKAGAKEEGRFFVRYESGQGNNTDSDVSIKAYFKDSEIYIISLNSDLINSVQLYDVNGKLLYSNQQVENLMLSINNAALQNVDFVIIKVVTENGSKNIKLIRTN